MELAYWVMLLSPVGVVMAVIAGLTPFLLSMIKKIIKLSNDVEGIHTELANIRIEFGVKLGEAQTKLPEDFANLRVDVAKLDGVLARAGIGNANTANPEGTVAKHVAHQWCRPRVACLRLLDDEKRQYFNRCPRFVLMQRMSFRVSQQSPEWNAAENFPLTSRAKRELSPLPSREPPLAASSSHDVERRRQFNSIDRLDNEHERRSGSPGRPLRSYRASRSSKQERLLPRKAPASVIEMARFLESFCSNGRYLSSERHRAPSGKAMALFDLS